VATYIGPTQTFSETTNNRVPTVAELETLVRSYIDGLSSVGMVQTADTGQLNPSSLPGWSSSWGYLIFRFNDSRQGTSPLFFKIRFGQGNNFGILRVYCTLGSSTNGAGTITGTVSSELSQHINAAGGGNWMNLFLSAVDGMLFIGNMYNSAGHYTFNNWFSIERTRDGSYLLDDVGATIMSGSTPTVVCQSLRFASPATVYTANSSFMLIPGLPTTTALLDGTKQFYPHFYNMPDIRQRWSTFTIKTTDVSSLPTKFICAPYVAEARQFIGFGNGTNGGVLCSALGNTGYTLAVLWED
jgi:hypothetical protein